MNFEHTFKSAGLKFDFYGHFRLFRLELTNI